MTNLTVFHFGIDEVRFVDGKPVANDVAHALGYADPAKTISTKVFDENKGVTKMVTPGGIQSVTVLEEAGIYQLIFSSKLETAKVFQQWVFNEVLPSIRKTGSYGFHAEPTIAALPPVTDETIKIHAQATKYYEDKGSLKIAQLIECRLGNLLLAENQALLSPTDVPQYEGVVEVATRLGFKVPHNYEGSLGTEVGKTCKHLRVGHNERFSQVSGNKIPAYMYPARHPDVETAVRNYCVAKSFYHRDINLLG